MEKFKQIKDYENYLISNRGRVYSEQNKKFLRPQNNSFGYLHVTLCKNGVRKTQKIHRLVALAFILNVFGKITVNHIDGIKTNNFVENLEWATDKENIRHAFDNGLMQKDEKNGQSKLSEDQVLEIRRIHKTGDYSQTALGKIFGVSQRLISYIINRKTWTHI